MVLFLVGQPGWVCLRSRELDQPSACFIGFALLVGLLHFALQNVEICLLCKICLICKICLLQDKYQKVK